MTPERIAELRQGYNAVIYECLDEIERLQAIVKVDDGRLVEAAKKAGVVYGGCDTPDDLADKILDQADQIRRLRDRLILYHAHSGDPMCHDCHLLAETEPDRGYTAHNPEPLDPLTMTPPTGGSAVVEAK